MQLNTDMKTTLPPAAPSSNSSTLRPEMKFRAIYINTMLDQGTMFCYPLDYAVYFLDATLQKPFTKIANCSLEKEGIEMASKGEHCSFSLETHSELSARRTHAMYYCFPEFIMALFIFTSTDKSFDGLNL